MIRQGLNTSIIGRAVENGLLSVNAVNIRDYTLDKHKKVDDYPYGGGAGMVMQAQPVYDAWRSVMEQIGYHPRCVYLTPQGRTFNQDMAKDFAKEEIRLVGILHFYDELLAVFALAIYIKDGSAVGIYISHVLRIQIRHVLHNLFAIKQAVEEANE